MPLYEYFCDGCRASFEALVQFSAWKQDVHTCPGCGGRSRRILSAVNFATERRTPNWLPSQHREGKRDVTSLTLPPAGRLCWMDNQSATRLAAYKAGRGAEYDDVVSARKEFASQRGESESVEPVQRVYSHSPLSDPTVFANRRAAAQKEKLTVSATIAKGGAAKEG
jgi:putative FmdB family regulatory protein